MENNNGSFPNQNRMQELGEAVRNITKEEIELFELFRDSKEKAPGIPVEDLLDGFVGRIGDRISSAVGELIGLSKKHEREVESVVKNAYEEVKKDMKFKHFDFEDLKEVYEKKKSRPLIPLRESYSEALKEVAEQLLNSKEYYSVQSLLYSLRGKTINKKETENLRSAFRKFFSVFVEVAKEKGVKLASPYQRIRAIAIGLLTSNLGISEDEAKRFLDGHLFPIGRGVAPLVSVEGVDALLPDELEGSPKMDQSYVAAMEAGLDSGAELESALNVAKAFYNLGTPLSFISAHDLGSQKAKAFLRRILLHERAPYAHMKAPGDADIQALEDALIAEIDSENKFAGRSLLTTIGAKAESHVYGLVREALGINLNVAKAAYLKPPLDFSENVVPEEVLGKVYGALSEFLFVSRLLHAVSERLGSHLNEARETLKGAHKQLLEAKDVGTLISAKEAQETATERYVKLSCGSAVTAFLKGKASLQALGAAITYFMALETHGIVNYGSLPLMARAMAARAVRARMEVGYEELREKYDGLMKKFVVNYQKVAPRNPSAAAAFNIVQERVGNDAGLHKQYLNSKKKR